MRSRTIPLIAAAAAASMLLASCGGGGEDDGATTGTLDFYTNKAAWEPDFDELNAQSEDDVDISLNTTGYSDAAQYDAFIKQSFRTDKSPGLFTWQTGPSLGELVDEGMVAETTDIWTKAVDEGWIGEDLKDAYTFDGRQYCVPMNVAYWVMYYNKHVFEEQGIAEPTTWAELDAAAEKLSGAGITPYYQTSTLFTFARVYLPMASSALVAVFILQATFIWNDFLLGLVLSQSDTVRPIVTSLAGMQSTYGGAQMSTVLAGGLLVSLPTVVLFLFTQKFFARGLALGQY